MVRNIQKIIAIFASVIVSLSMIVLPVNAEEEIRVFLDGQKISFDVPPQIINDYTMVPMRAIFEALGYDVTWNDTDKSITAVNGSNMIFMKLLSNEMTYNDDVITLDIAPISINGRTLVPVRAISETIGYNVSWDSANRSVIIGDMPDISYYNATKEIEQINSFIEQGLYLEAIESCEQTISWHTLSPLNVESIDNLRKRAEYAYQTYLNNKITYYYGQNSFAPDYGHYFDLDILFGEPIVANDISIYYNVDCVFYEYEYSWEQEEQYCKLLEYLGFEFISWTEDGDRLYGKDGNYIKFGLEITGMGANTKAIMTIYLYPINGKDYSAILNPDIVYKSRKFK